MALTVCLAVSDMHVAVLAGCCKPPPPRGVTASIYTNWPGVGGETTDIGYAIGYVEQHIAPVK